MRNPISPLLEILFLKIREGNIVKGRERNAPCWCGSGEKYKKCHLGRESQPKENPWAAVGLNRKAFSQKKCCALNAGLGDCDGRVIKAHTVSRGPNLAKIAKEGHVLQYSANIPEMFKNGGNLSVGEIGIKDASVFFGFCGRHDRDLFSCIENESFSGRPDQCLAVAYRSISRELYGKDASAHLRETLRSADKGMQLFEQFMLQEILDEVDAGNEAARRELRATHEVLTSAMANARFDVINSIIIEFPAPLPFMFAGAWSPFTDLYDKKLQEGYLHELLEQVFVSSFICDSGSMICFSWRNIHEAPGKVIADQIFGLPSEQKASVCLQYVMKHIENVFFNPDWFENLSDKQRSLLNSLASDGLDIQGNVPSTTIQVDEGFDLPTAVRSFWV